MGGQAAPASRAAPASARPTASGPQGACRVRLARYASGKAVTSGLGEAVADRAFADRHFVLARLDDIDEGVPKRASAWGRSAFEWADLHIRWATTADKKSAVQLERRCIAAYGGEIWNRAIAGRIADDTQL